MKIATITCHHVYNYGATLQAFALQQYLLSMGLESEIIDFIPWYHKRYEFWHINRNSSHYDTLNKNVFLKLIWCLRYNLPYLLKEYKRKFAFDKFDSNYLKFTKRKYSNIEELKSFPPVADMYICGSDQIWNQDATFGIEKAYYLDFGESDTYRMSYAASFGCDQIHADPDELKSLIDKFDFISIREKSGINILRKLGFSDIRLVVDPVFLLSTTQWYIYARSSRQIKTPEKYILLYNFKQNDKIRRFVMELKSNLNLPIVCLHGYDEIQYADINIRDAGPFEFIKLIESAEVIVSDSFHATVYSIIFNKEFYTFSLCGQNNTARMEDLLNGLDIRNRLNVEIPSSEKIDYNDVTKRLQPMIDKSKDFLHIIEKVRNHRPVN